MSKHPIPDWLRSQFSRIEDEVRTLGPCGVFTQMRTVTQTYFEQAAAAPQPPALGGEPVEPWYYYAECADPDYSCLCNNEADALTEVADHGGSVVKLWNVAPDHNLAPLQAEIERWKACYEEASDKHSLAYAEANALADQVDQLKARNAELEGLLQMFIDNSDDRDVVELSRNALSKPAGSEQAPTLEIPSRTIKLSGCELTESDLLESAVRAVRGSRRNTLPRWALVRDAFCVGSGVGTALCRRFGFDPDEVLKS